MPIKSMKISAVARFTKAPQRIGPHRVDTQAVRIVRTKLTPDWVERSVEDRDYGVDMMLEIFDGIRPTGTLLLFQIKGRSKSFGGEVTLSVPVKTLLYAQMFQAPFFLVTASLKDKKVRFVWLQKYINTKLVLENRDWTRQESVSVYFPKDNILNNKGLRKIRELVTYTTHRDAGFSFLAHLIWLKQHISEFGSDGGTESLEQALIHLGEIEKQEDFLSAYENHTEGLDLAELRKVLSKAKAYGTYDYGHDDFVDEQITCLSRIELMFLSKHETDAFVAENSDKLLPY